jgi:hypothetical protein
LGGERKGEEDANGSREENATYPGQWHKIIIELEILRPRDGPSCDDAECDGDDGEGEEGECFNFER